MGIRHLARTHPQNQRRQRASSHLHDFLDQVGPSIVEDGGFDQHAGVAVHVLNRIAHVARAALEAPNDAREARDAGPLGTQEARARASDAPERQIDVRLPLGAANRIDNARLFGEVEQLLVEQVPDFAGVFSAAGRFAFICPGLRNDFGLRPAVRNSASPCMA